MLRPTATILPRPLLSAAVLGCAALTVTACDTADAPADVADVVDDLGGLGDGEPQKVLANTAPDGPLPVTIAHVDLEPLDGAPEALQDLEGSLTFVPHEGGGVAITGTLSGLDDAGYHGLHVHEKGDCSAPDGSSAGGHFSPGADPHGAPGTASHAGDLGNVTVVESGNATVEVVSPDASLDGFLGRAVILHAGHDDLATQPSGDSGARIACGVIQRGAS